CMYTHTDGAYNTCVGAFCFQNDSNTTNRKIGIGTYAGINVQEEGAFVVDSYSRASQSLSQNESILYGVMNADVEDQTLQVNGTFKAKRFDGTDRDIFYEDTGEFRDITRFDDQTTSTTFSVNQSLPLNGIADYLMNTAIATDYVCTENITVPIGSRGRYIGAEFKYSYDGDDNDYSVALYDVTNSATISTIYLETGSSKRDMASGFTQSTTALVKVCWTVDVANAGKILQFDDIILTANPNKNIKIYASTEWEDAGNIVVEGTTSDPTKGTTDLDKTWWRRDGSDMIIRYELNSTVNGAAGSGDYLFSIPSGYTIDTSKIEAYSTVEGSGQFNAKSSIGSGKISNNTDSGILSGIVYDTSRVRFCGLTSSGGCVSNTFFGFATGAAGHSFSALIRVPIEGWTDTADGVVKNVDVPENVYSARIDNNGTATIVSQNSDFISSVTRTGAGVVDIVWESGIFTVAPVLISVSTDTTNGYTPVVSITSSGATIRHTNDGGTYVD
ncbi:MAG: hypothetical protein V2J13_10900, partial [Cycloclasticus sp.]|nr:hypothetical protein [Cycloclasticus sp.]